MQPEPHEAPLSGRFHWALGSTACVRVCAALVHRLRSRRQGHARRLLAYVANDHFMTGGKTLGGTEMEYDALGRILSPLLIGFDRPFYQA